MPRPRRRKTKGSGYIRKHGRYYWIQYQAAGQRVNENTHLEDEAQAQALLKQRLAESAGGQIVPSKATVADFCNLVLADYRLRKRKDLKTVEWRYNAHVKDELGPIPATRCTGAHIRAYIAKRRADFDKKGKPTSDSTINRELSIVRRGFTLAMQEDPPLIAKAPYIPKLDEDNVRQGFLEPEQADALLRELPESLKALFVCAYHLGTRSGELRRLRWDQVDLDALVIRLPGRQTKNNKPRTLPIYGEMEPWIRSQLASRPEGCLWVFQSRGKPVSGKLPGWEEACNRAGFSDLLFHDLRRSAVRNMKRAGIQDSVAMAISGHKTRAIFDRYNIVDSGDLDDAGQKLDAYFTKRKQAPKLKRVK